MITYKSVIGSTVGCAVYSGADQNESRSMVWTLRGSVVVVTWPNRADAILPSTPQQRRTTRGSNAMPECGSSGPAGWQLLWHLPSLRPKTLGLRPRRASLRETSQQLEENRQEGTLQMS